MAKEWDYRGIMEKFEANRNGELAIPMAAYMRNQFPFFGIKTPLRKQLLKEHFSEYTLPARENLFAEAWKIYRLPEREYQYAAIALMEKMQNSMVLDDLSLLQNFIEAKSWWDSVDSIAPRIVGHIVKNDRFGGEKIMLQWSQSENIWTNRSSILHQLKYKNQTDTDLLSHILLEHAASNEFFIQKAIGWSLREYAKTDPDFVYSFVNSHSFKPLSKREALKHYKKE